MRMDFQTTNAITSTTSAVITWNRLKFGMERSLHVELDWHLDSLMPGMQAHLDQLSSIGRTTRISGAPVLRGGAYMGLDMGALLPRPAQRGERPERGVPKTLSAPPSMHPGVPKRKIWPAKNNYGLVTSPLSRYCPFSERPNDPAPKTCRTKNRNCCERFQPSRNC